MDEIRKQVMQKAAPDLFKEEPAAAPAEGEAPAEAPESPEPPQQQ